MRRELEFSNEGQRAYFTYWCQAHLINLTIKAVDGVFKQASVRIVALLKFLRAHQATLAQLSACKLPRPPIPVETRWNSLIESIAYFDRHWARIVEIVRGSPAATETERRTAEDLQLLHAARDMMQCFEPLGNALAVIERDRSTLADAYHEFLHLNQV